ncbi:TonB-dependent receptor [Novosphingobium sp. ERN07]|uniref:TonB-dependent receptor n=1 Tax=Novosphingobium sp. ERN07 TaxID=2726187 RepID=UPI001456D265|nr:TonB-dependent receptor [Novosphingobium sp. ERN07]
MLGGAIAALGMAATPAFAADYLQTTDAAAAPAETSPEIIVTAQKRREALDKVPISIAAVSSEQLEKRNISQVLDLPQTVPALRVNYAGTFVLPTIRGVGSIVALPGLTQNIATYVDGFYVPAPSSSNFDLVNVASINVLKGPQGTLFGANSTGGAIQINTKAPSFDTSVLFRVGYSSYDTVSSAFYGTTGLGDKAAIDLAASYETSDGYVRNIVTGNNHVAAYDKYSIRTKLLLEPVEGVKFTLGYEHNFSDDPISQMVVPRDGITLGALDPTVQLSYDSPKRVALDNPGYARFKTDAFMLTSQFDFGFATLTSYTQYRKESTNQGLDYDASPAPINFSFWTVRDKTFTEEVNLSSNGDGRLKWTTGLFLLDYKNSYDFNTHLYAFGIDLDVFETRNHTKSWGGFADATYELLDNLFLTGGIRYTEDKPSLDFDLQAFGLTGAGSAKFHNTSVRGVARYQLTPRSNVYASYSQGYRSGGLPGSAFSTIPVKPEKIDAFELGYKNAEGPLNLNLAAFYYNYRDIQVTSYGAGGQSFTVNAAAAHIYGLDGDLTYAFSPDFSVTLAGTYTHAKYTDFPNALGRYLDPTDTNPDHPFLGAFQVDASGKRVERTPSFAGSVSANYGFDLAGGHMALSGNVFYTGSYFFDPAHQLKQPTYTLVNLRATWTDPSDHLDLAIFGKNITNAKYYVANFVDPYSARARFGQPAIFGGSISYRY